MIRLGLTADLISLPITLQLTASFQTSEFEIKEQSLQKNYIDLIQKKLDAAFISPLDYARDSTLLKLAKNIAIYNKGESRYSVLFFRKDLIEIEEIAYQSDSHYNDLTFLLLREFFDMEPKWRLVSGNSMAVEMLLESYQAVLQNGMDALENYPNHENRIDIVDQWTDKTGLAFIHQVLAVNKDVQDKRWLDTMYRSRENGIGSLNQISESYAKYHRHSSGFYLDLLQNIYQYIPNEIVWKDCAEYFKYLFYYGKIPFMPEFNFV